MKSIKTLSIILAIGALMGMSSCLKSDNDGYTVTNSFTHLFNAVVDRATGEVTLYSDQSLKVDWNYTTTQATVQILGLKLPDVGSFPALQFDNVPFGINSRGWVEMGLKDVKPSGASGYAASLTFNKFSFQTCNRTYNNLTFPPCLDISYTINDQYNVYALPAEMIEVGESTITDSNGQQYKPTNAENLTIYYIELDPATKKGYVVIQGAKFATNMPAMNMKFPSIPFEVNEAGHIIMTKDEIVPTLMGSTDDITAAGTPAPNFPITNFRATFIANQGVEISYNCTPTGKDGNPMGLYSVRFRCQYPTSANSTQPA